MTFLVDNDLSPHIAEALGLFGFEIQTVKDTLFSSASDEEIIPWLGETETIWITHDKGARRRHIDSIKRHRVSVLWVAGKKLSSWDQMKIVARVIDQVASKVTKARGALHFRAGVRGRPTPEIVWAERPEDMPRGSD